MKSRLTALLLTLALLLTALPVCTAEEEASATRMPFYDVFPLQLDDNTVLELPVDWGYQFVELEGVPPIAYAMNDSEQLLMMVKIPADYTPNEASDRLGLTSFIPEGTAVMLGITTPQSTRLQEMTINDMPAVLVEMKGQGFDILWIGDSGDLYFLMFPNDDDTFVQQALEVGQSLRVFHRKDERVNPASDFDCTTENGEVTITDYTGTREHVLIPSEIGGFPVTALADKAFYEKHVTTVVVPDSVTEIGDLCFSGDNYLVSLTLPDGLAELSYGALESCYSLMDFELPKGLKTIGEGALQSIFYLTHLTIPAGVTDIEQMNFLMMHGLEEVSVAEGSTSFTYDAENGLLMTADKARLLHCFFHLAPQKEIILPEGMKTIDPFAFHYDVTVEKIVLPEGAETIGLLAFGICPKLTEIVIPASVTAIGVMEGQAGSGSITSFAQNVLVTPEGSPAWDWAQKTGVTVKAPETNE
ncbi:MAG: leucine-rich repeat domain-containing protein [Clostridiales bacterium]|nr:leucine-rich repeat domain-containing protein [Clostridiales bacterium]